MQNLPNGVRFEDLKVVGDTPPGYIGTVPNPQLHVKAEGNKILFTMDDGYGYQGKITITGKIVYEKDGIRQEKEFTTIARKLYLH